MRPASRDVPLVFFMLPLPTLPVQIQKKPWHVFPTKAFSWVSPLLPARCGLRRLTVYHNIQLYLACKPVYACNLVIEYKGHVPELSRSYEHDWYCLQFPTCKFNAKLVAASAPLFHTCVTRSSVCQHTSLHTRLEQNEVSWGTPHKKKKLRYFWCVVFSSHESRALAISLIVSTMRRCPFFPWWGHLQVLGIFGF